MRIACVRQTTFSSVLIDLDAQVDRYAPPTALPVGTRVRTPAGHVIEQVPWGSGVRALVAWTGVAEWDLPLIAGGEYSHMQRDPRTGRWSRIEVLPHGEPMRFRADPPAPDSPLEVLARQNPRATKFVPGYCDDRPYCE